MRRSLTLVLIGAFLIGCGGTKSEPTATDPWSALWQKTPFPYTTPLPPADVTVLDGTYTTIDPKPEEYTPCRRCPPYPPGGGVWKLSFDRGIFRVLHPDTGWHTLGSFTVSKDHLFLFNDPHCYEALGIYQWKLQSGRLTLQLVADACGKNLRTKRFTQLPWTSCSSPETEAALAGHCE